MNTNFLLIILIIFLLFYLNNKYNNIDNFQNISHSIINIKNLTKELSIYRPVGSENLKLVKNKVTNKIKEIGLSFSEQKFNRTINNKVYQFSNLIGSNPNSNGPYILLGAHIDSPQIEGCESTIDSVTGIVIILELAKNLLKINPNLPLMILFVDGEEAIDGPWSKHNTLSGSKYFVNNFDLSLIKKVYIFDLIGADIEKNKLAAFSNNNQTYSDFYKLAEINKKYNHQIFLSPSEFVSLKSIEDDHIPFKEKGLYAMNLIPYKFPNNHHTLEDNYQNVNWDYIEIFYNVFFEFLK